MILKYKCLPVFLHPACKAFFLQALFLCSYILAYSQFTARFRLDDLPPGHLHDSVFAAGSFNGWNPSKNGTFISTPGTPAYIQVNDLKAGTYEFKFTRGSWQTVECLADGKDMGNRQIQITGDTVIRISIETWKDNFSATAKQHTASPNVQIIDTAFFMPQLGRKRRIWLYLPPGYTKSRKRYPVIYMQDGQNIFDSYTAAFGEWGVDETVDSMTRAGRPACIVVGIDNGPGRMNEYNPYEFKDFGKGEGSQYVDFIKDNLKPFIDKHYRTLRDSENTIIAGSSMGGLIAYYAMLKYPDVFGKGGIFSPAFWTAEKIKLFTDSSGKNLKGMLFFYIGELEGEKYINDMQDITGKLGYNSTALIYSVTDPEGEHNEQAWRKWFPRFYCWVLSNGFSDIIDPEDD